MDCHEGPGVIPGRYAGEPIRIHEGPTPQQVAYEEQRADADALAGRICAAAAEATRSQYRLLELVGEFDAMDAIRFLDRRQIVGALAVVVLLDDTRGGTRTCPGRQSTSEDAGDQEPV
jgi:hypothetical protein